MKKKMLIGMIAGISATVLTLGALGGVRSVVLPPAKIP